MCAAWSNVNAPYVCVFEYSLAVMQSSQQPAPTRDTVTRPFYPWALWEAHQRGECCRSRSRAVRTAAETHVNIFCNISSRVWTHAAILEMNSAPNRLKWFTKKERGRACSDKKIHLKTDGEAIKCHQSHVLWGLDIINHLKDCLCCWFDDTQQ